ncbi:putative RNA-binding Zn ribbon-like protein [Actinomadura pelletieri DSM 43383]|uniref:Putative RNA-binding Zn ribbon-like protein n=1 Tax=Actinomadura pelletieri DSM 43383 TaxID=1120940 RepID=A0A495QX05_9ACTN|nr:ABATE domain-containing protein [Actinomadura pelletieri]RKS78721.1 putative RNA-binding Zn ribbon-like protein [Actinomadura pelletieri DSM 43383]
MPTGTATRAPLLGEPLAVEFMNTVWADRSGIHDALTTADEIAAWLRASPQIPGCADRELHHWLAVASTRDLEKTGMRLRELRDAVRRLAATQTDDPREHAASRVADHVHAVSVINHATARAPHWSRLDWHDGVDPGRRVQTASKTPAVITAGIAEQAIHLFTSEKRHGLRTCLAPGCVLYFIKQHPRREWCSAACGNRARAARHYQRHKAGDRKN